MAGVLLWCHGCHAPLGWTDGARLVLLDAVELCVVTEFRCTICGQRRRWTPGPIVKQPAPDCAP